MLRKFAFAAAILLAVLALAIFLVLPRINLAPLAASRATAWLGRTVTIRTLRVTPGRWFAVAVEDAHLASIPGGSRPDMAIITRLNGELDPLSLLLGPTTLRHLSADGISLLFERTREHRANWQGDVERAKPAGPADRSFYPTILGADLRGAEILYRGAGGTTLRTALDEITIQTGGRDRPVRLQASGTYNAAPVALDTTLQSFDALRDASRPVGTDLRMVSRDTKLHFVGTMTDPLNVDGASGTLSLDAAAPSQLLAIAGIASTAIPPLTVTGPFIRRGDVWEHRNAAGTLKDMAFRAKTLRLTEGGGGKPDQIAADIAFDRLDLGFLDTSGGTGGRTGADIPLSVDRNPGVLIDGQIAAGRLIYGDLAFDQAKLDAALTPGRITLRALSLGYLGAAGQASASVEAAADGGRIQVDATVSGIDVQKLRQTIGIRSLPLTGQLDATLSANAAGKTVREATKAGRIAAVLTMKAGTMPREIIEAASTDLRLLFRKAGGTSPISCLLGVATIEDGAGRLAPFRIRSAHGTLAGAGRFDLYRRTLDVVVGSQSATTSSFALDIPVQITGSFANPSVGPAKLTASGRALLATAAVLPALPPSLAQAARGSACLP